MYEFKDVRIRKFEKKDIDNKIKWINDIENNEFLHFDLPLEYDKTLRWYERTKDRKDRYDAVIEYQGIPVGIVGLTNIDYKNKKAEDYLIVGDTSFKRKGIATKAGALICLYGFKVLGLNKIVAHIEYGNPSLFLNKKRGFFIEGYLRDDLWMVDHYVDRFLLGMFERDLILPDEVNWIDED